MKKLLVLHSVTDSIKKNQTIQSGKVLWQDIVHITKPRIITSNLIAAFSGFWLASQGNVNWLLMLNMLFGSTLVMACACVFNNYLDREMDQKMARTRNRPIAAGRLQSGIVLWYGVILGIIGLMILFNINLLCGIFGAIGIFVYVVIYTAWLKRTSTFSTVVGGISGAMPPVIGYCAASATIDTGAWILFFILFLWQPPHFWSLGISRKEEYHAAGFPLLPVVKGVLRTKIQMILYVVILIPTTVLLYIHNYVGIFYLSSAIILGLIWLAHCLTGFTANNDDTWAMKNFRISICYLTIILLIIAIDTVRL
jgi:protoheme IX farnesyltransferase